MSARATARFSSSVAGAGTGGTTAASAAWDATRSACAALRSLSAARTAASRAASSLGVGLGFARLRVGKGLLRGGQRRRGRLDRVRSWPSRRPAPPPCPARRSPGRRLRSRRARRRHAGSCRLLPRRGQLALSRCEVLLRGQQLGLRAEVVALRGARRCELLGRRAEGAVAGGLVPRSDRRRRLLVVDAVDRTRVEAVAAAGRLPAAGRPCRRCPGPCRGTRAALPPSRTPGARTP
jgi:hypothetical protein